MLSMLLPFADEVVTVIADQAVWKATMTLVTVWSITGCAAPVGGLLMAGFDMLSEQFRAKTIDEVIEETNRARFRDERRASHVAAQRGKTPPAPTKGTLTLGTVIRWADYPLESGITSQTIWCQLAAKTLTEHMSVIGATGSGKTTYLLRLILEILLNTEYDLFVVDGKGDAQFAEAVRGLMYKLRGVNAPLFRLGYGTPGSAYNGFRGSPQALYNRFVELASIPQMEGNAIHYAELMRIVLQYIFYHPGGPPRSFEEVFRRLNPAWLKSAYKNMREEEWTIDLITKPLGKDQSPAVQVALRLASVMKDLKDNVSHHGFCLEHARCAVFSLRTQTASDVIGRFVPYLIEDLKDMIGNVKRQKRRCVVLFDEFAPLRTEKIHTLLSIARSMGCGVVLATQDVASLGDLQNQRLILANTTTRILLRTDFPEEMVKLAGTELQPENSIHYTQGLPTAEGSVRFQHTFAIDPNEVARLPSGDAFVIRHRHAARIHVHPVLHTPEAPAAPIYTPTPKKGNVPPAPNVSPLDIDP